MATVASFIFLIGITLGQFNTSSSTLPPCYDQGKCNYGYYDSTNGNSNKWLCGENCVGGAYYDRYCRCACKPLSECDSSPTPYPTFSDVQYEMTTSGSIATVIVVFGIAIVGSCIVFCLFGGLKSARSCFGICQNFEDPKKKHDANKNVVNTQTVQQPIAIQPVVYNQTVPMTVVQQPILQPQQQPIQVMVVTKEQMALIQAQQGQVAQIQQTQAPMMVPVHQPIVQNVSAAPNYAPSAPPPPAYNEVAASAPEDSNHFDNEDTAFKREGQITAYQ